MIQREATSQDFNTNTKQETIKATSDSTLTKITKAASSSQSWSKLKDPRIVRVSRAFGGKDRHSKVCTVRGLRDRRVRLSVPTAIELYDLQDRLGLNQPSKVVDWLLDVAKHEIDELPPLQIPPGIFPHQYHPTVMNQSDKSQSLIWAAGKSKDLGSSGDRDHDLDNWMVRSSSSHHQDQEDQRQQQLIMTLDHDHDQSQSNINVLSRMQHNNHPSNTLSTLIRSWDPSSLTLSHPPRAHHHHQSSEGLQNFSLVPLPSSTLNSVLVYQSGATQSYFPSSSNTEFDPKNLSFEANNTSVDHHEESNTTQSVVRPFHFMSTVNLLPSENNHHQQNKHSDFRLG